MLAVKASRTHVVDFMLSVDNPATAVSLTLRDIQGSLPLHIAVKNGLVRITTSLIKSSESRLLYTEDGIGITPLEITSLQHLLRLTRSKEHVGGAVTWKTPPKVTSLTGNNIDKYSERVERPEIEVAETLSALLQSLDAEGRFTNKQELKDVLTDYARRTMEIARKSKEKEENRTSESQTGLGSQTEGSDMVGTFKLIKSVIGHSTRRELVHLLDTQRAVGDALVKAVKQGQNHLGDEVGDELGKETVETTQVKQGLMQILATGTNLYNKEEA